MKVQTLVLDDEIEAYVDCYIDENQIIGYYWTSLNMDDDSMNVLFGNTTLTIKQTKEIMDFLIKKDWH